MSDELYVGYLEKAPPAVARLVRRTILLLLLLAAAVAALLAALQAPFDPGAYEFGEIRSFEGVVALQPVPQLLVDRPGSDETSRYVVALPGKYGAATELEPFDGQRVELDGALIYRDDATMIELVAGSVRADGGPASVNRRTLDEGDIVVVGEIVDSKCFFGLMKPGRTKPHRACAAACIRGGIPAALYAEDAVGEERIFLLAGADGEALGPRILDRVGEPVAVAGRARREGETWILETSPERIERIR